MDYHMAHNDEKQASVFSHDIYIYDKMTSKVFSLLWRWFS
jgi:hypothetical protein